MVLIVGRADDVAIGIDDIRLVTIRGRKCQEQNAFPAYEASLSHTAIDCLKTGNLGIWEIKLCVHPDVMSTSQPSIGGEQQDQARPSKTKQNKATPTHPALEYHPPPPGGQ